MWLQREDIHHLEDSNLQLISLLSLQLLLSHAREYSSRSILWYMFTLFIHSTIQCCIHVQIVTIHLSNNQEKPLETCQTAIQTHPKSLLQRGSNKGTRSSLLERLRAGNNKMTESQGQTIKQMCSHSGVCRFYLINQV